MATASEQGLLGQILAEVRIVGAEVTTLRVDVAAVISDAAHRSTQTDDHEKRIRDIEAVMRDAVTQNDLEALDERRAKVVSEALLAADRKAQRRQGWFAVIVTLALGGVTIAMNILTGH